MANSHGIRRSWIFLSLLSAVCCLFGQQLSAGELISRWPESKHEFKVASTETSRDGKTLTVTIDNPRGIFAAALWLNDAKVETVTLQVKQTAEWEGVSLQLRQEPLPAGQPNWKEGVLERSPVDLKEIKEVAISAAGADCKIEFTGKAVELLRRGGRFQFIDYYR